MADTKIHDLTSGTPALTTDELPVNRGGFDRKLTIADLLAISANPLLGFHAFAAGSDTALITTSSTSFVDVDATNAAVTFTAPSSGKVLVRLSALTDLTVNSSSIYFGLREASSDIASALVQQTAEALRATAAFYLTGLTPGSSHTYKASIKVSANTAHIYTGPGYGSLVLEVWALP